MLDRESNIKKILGDTPLGGRFSSQNEIRAALAKRGLTKVDKSTIAGMRSGKTSGKFLFRDAEIEEVSQTEDGSFKIDFYQLIAKLGIEAREHQQIRPERWSSVGFTERLSENIGLRFAYLTKIINALRLDMMFHTIFDPTSLPDNLLQTFHDCTEKYFSDYDPKKDGNKNTVYEIEAYWDGVSIPSFYQVLRKRNNPRVTGTWGSYEMEVLFTYYKGLELQNYPLTPLDFFIIGRRKEDALQAKREDYLNREYSIDIDKTTLIFHTNALIGRFDPLTRALGY